MTQTHRFKVGKLVRDKFPQFMRESDIQGCERTMGEEEYLQRLKDKLVEEAQEVAESGSLQEIREELADVLEVMLTLLRVHGLAFVDIQETAEQKRTERGGFNTKIYSDFIAIKTGNPHLEYYRARPDKYPELKKN